MMQNYLQLQDMYGVNLVPTNVYSTVHNPYYFITHVHIVCSIGIYGKKSQEKSFWTKKSQFSQVLGQNVPGNEVLSFRFPKISEKSFKLISL